MSLARSGQLLERDVLAALDLVGPDRDLLALALVVEGDVLADPVLVVVVDEVVHRRAVSDALLDAVQEDVGRVVGLGTVGAGLLVEHLGVGGVELVDRLTWDARAGDDRALRGIARDIDVRRVLDAVRDHEGDRKSTRLNSSHANISYAVFCLKKKKTIIHNIYTYIDY